LLARRLGADLRADSASFRQIENPPAALAENEPARCQVVVVLRRDAGVARDTRLVLDGRQGVFAFAADQTVVVRLDVVGQGSLFLGELLLPFVALALEFRQPRFLVALQLGRLSFGLGERLLQLGNPLLLLFDIRERR